MLKQVKISGLGTRGTTPEIRSLDGDRGSTRQFLLYFRDGKKTVIGGPNVYFSYFLINDRYYPISEQAAGRYKVYQYWKSFWKTNE